METTTNPLLLKLRIPGATHRLPSRGLFYEDGELDASVVNGEVEIYPMTAIDEITLSTPDKLISGKALFEVFERRIPSIKKPWKLLSRDVDHLMVCLRLVSFGPFMDIAYVHNCEGAKQHTYEVNLDEMVKAARMVDPTTIKDEYSTTLANGQVVTFVPMTYGDTVELYKNVTMHNPENATYEQTEKFVVGALASVIKSVDDIKDKQLIEQWIRELPLGWKKELEASAQQISVWGIDFNTTQICRDCGEPMQVQVTANPVHFFT